MATDTERDFFREGIQTGNWLKNRAPYGGDPRHQAHMRHAKLAKRHNQRKARAYHLGIASTCRHPA